MNTAAAIPTLDVTGAVMPMSEIEKYDKKIVARTKMFQLIDLGFFKSKIKAKYLEKICDSKVLKRWKENNRLRAKQECVNGKMEEYYDMEELILMAQSDIIEMYKCFLKTAKR